ncbi:hypothetical protein KQH54_03825 [bacterium]|nr:hypothetical protein [bacterium]
MNPYYAISSKTYNGSRLAQRTAELRKKRTFQLGVALGGGLLVGILAIVSPLLAFVLLFGIVYLVKAFEKPILLAYLVIGSIGITSGIERGRIIPLLAPNEVILLLVIFMTIAIMFTREFKRTPLPPYFYWALALIAIGRFIFPIGIFLLRGTPITTKIVFNFFSPLQYFLLYWVFLTLPQNDQERKGIIRLMIYIAMIVGLVGLLQMAGVGFITSILHQWYGSAHGEVALEVGRATSFLGGWNALGTFMMANFFLAWTYLPDEDNTLHKLAIIASTIVIFSTLILTTSFASAIGLVIGTLILMRITKRFKINLPVLIAIIFVIMIFALLFIAVFEQFVANRFAYQYRYGGIYPQTLVFRFEVWRDVFLPPILESFPLPVLPTVPETYAWRFEESQYILLLFRNGLVGFLFFLGWIGGTLAWLKKQYDKATGYTRSIIAVSATLMIVLSIMGFTNAVFTYSGTADYLWMMLALISNKGNHHDS